MSKAIGMVEYKTTSAGVVAADSMVKTSEVSIIEAQTVMSGKIHCNYYRRFKCSNFCC